MNFALWDILIFLCSLCGIYPRGRLVCIKNTKSFFLVFLLSVEALLEQILMNFDLGHLTFFSLSLFSLCGIYPREGLPNKITKRFILVFLLSVGALLEQILMNFDSGYFNFSSSQSFFSLCNLPQGKISQHKNTKKGFTQSFFSLWKLSLSGS